MGFALENQVRTGLTAGGRRIRTIGPSRKKRVVLVETRRLLKGADDRDPSKLQPFSRGTGSSNPSPSSAESGANLAFGGRSRPFTVGEPKVRIHLPPAASPLRTACRPPARAAAHLSSRR